MDEAAVEEAEGSRFGGATESTGDGEGRHLDEASQFDPTLQAVEVAQHQHVALGMNQDGHDAGIH